MGWNRPRPPHAPQSGTARGHLRASLLTAGYVLAASLPLAVAAAAGAPGRPGLHDVGSTIAMVGFAALLLEFVLSGRLRALTDPLGMDALMRFHQFAGHVVLALLLAHPYLYALIPPEAAAGRTLPGAGGSPLAGVTGFVAWFGLIALVFTAIARDSLPVTYETWRLGHGLGSAAIAVLALVHTLGAGTAAATPAVGAFWIAAVVLALLTLVHVYAVKPWLRTRRPWRVRAVTPLAPGIHELWLDPDGHAGLDFRPGQFAWLRLAPHPWGLREHPFSIASAPGDGPGLRFVIKANGDFTGRIGDVVRGARAWVDGPYGRFGPRGDDDALLLVAGGVGLAPILALLRDLRDAGDRRPIRLVYACRWQRDMVLADELDALARDLDLGIVRLVDEAERPPGSEPGPLSRALLERSLPAVERHRLGCCICAPPGMIDATETMLAELGVPPGRIVSERFRYRYGAGSPVARRAQRVYLAVAGVLVLAAITFAAAT